VPRAALPTGRLGADGDDAVAVEPDEGEVEPDGGEAEDDEGEAEDGAAGLVGSGVGADIDAVRLA
jgi:hypothetical protein